MAVLHSIHRLRCLCRHRGIQSSHRGQASAYSSSAVRVLLCLHQHSVNQKVRRSLFNSSSRQSFKKIQVTRYRVSFSLVGSRARTPFAGEFRPACLPLYGGSWSRVTKAAPSGLVSENRCIIPAGNRCDRSAVPLPGPLHRKVDRLAGSS